MNDNLFVKPAAELLDDFDGHVRLFPLPGTVLFPGVGMPLHIFEPRYRQMLADALRGDSRITLVMLRPGWEAEYAARPPVHSVACLGHVDRHEPLADGCSNILLRGLVRVRILSEDRPKLPYRTAHVQILAEPETSATSLNDLDATFLRALQATLALAHTGSKGSQQILREYIAPGQLCDIAASLLRMAAEVQQRLLEEIDIGRRVEQLRTALTASLESDSPPDTGRSDSAFSAN